MQRWLRRLAILAVSLGLLVAVTPASSGAADDEVTASSAHRPDFGVQFHGMWSTYTDADRIRYLDRLAATGATWVRLDVSWAMLQPTSRDSYDLRWGVPFIDRVLDMITDRGLKPLVTLWRTPGWANGGASELTLPHDVADFARAAGWAADRWKGQVPAWEVWNEPNHKAYMVGADPAAYTRLLRATYPAIKAADPSATVVFGGTESNDSPWIAKAYAAGAAGHFDAMATHPYMAIADLPPEVPDDGTKYNFTHLASIHELMKRHGDGHKPIWATEFGWSSHPNHGGEQNWERGVTPQQQADYAVRALRLVEQTMPYVTHLFWYTDRDRPDDSDDPQLSNYGFFGADFSPKPITTAVAAHLRDRSATPAPAPAPAPAPGTSVADRVTVVDCSTPVTALIEGTVLCAVRPVQR